MSSLSPNHLAGVSLRATPPHRYASNGFCFLVLVQDDHGKAQTEFNKIHSDLKNPTQQKVLQDEFLLLRAQVSQELKNRVPLLDFFRQKSLRKRCIIGWLTFFAGQGTATLVINSKGIPLCAFPGFELIHSKDYGPSLYASLGFNTVQQLLIQCGWISVCPFANFVNSLIVDRVGRTRLLSKPHIVVVLSSHHLLIDPT